MIEKIQVNVMVNKINRILNKNGIKYEYNPAISSAFIGEGFYVNHKYKTVQRLPIWGYDKNSAYKSVLCDEVFPLSSELRTIDEGGKQTELGIYIVTLNKTTMKKKFPEFDYTLYSGLQRRDIKGEKLYYMTNIDYKIFTTLYDSDIKIDTALYFQHIGSLPQELKDLCHYYYDMKQQVKIDPTMSQKDKDEWKINDEISFYGIHAKKLINYKDKKKINTRVKNNGFKPAYAMFMQEEAEWKYASRLTQCEDIRKKNTAIAMFQTAYLRKIELDMFLKYKDSVVYMNTDSIHSDKPLPINPSNKLGDWKLEYNGNEMLYVRRNGYIDLTSNKVVMGGLDKNITLSKDDIKKLECGISVEIDGYTINPRFIDNMAK